MVYYVLKSYSLNGLDALGIFEALSIRKNPFFLDTSLGRNKENLGRYSILGSEPFAVLQEKNRSPFKELREILNRYKIDRAVAPLPFFGGGVGYLTYDLGLTLEKKIKKKNKPELSIPDAFFAFYNTGIIIDHQKELLYILALGFPEKKYYLAKLLAENNFKNMLKIISNIRKKKASGVNSKKIGLPTPKLESNFTKDEYLSAISRAKEYIKAGDIYQVNLSQQFKASTQLSSPEIYRRLRRVSPSYFSAYFDAGDFQILSSSPERFLKLDKSKVVTRPMKGTMPRGRGRTQDRAFRRELLNSAKDKAELVMIVDLERNDLGRVCSYNSINVDTLRQLEEYSTVFQTTANISGRLHKDKDRIDLLHVCFPGGSITGCPKIRAMEIIEELEPGRRSIYTGSLGYLSFSGNMDFNILIRTILKKQNQLYFGTGGGIVADSRPEAEYAETLIKAKGMIEAIT